MAKSLNRAQLVGRLGSDPELKFRDDGEVMLCNFSVATDSNYKNKDDEWVEKTDWHRVVVWGKLAEICGEYLQKGRQVYLEGRLQTRSWEDDNGVKKYTTEIVANNVIFMGSREDVEETVDDENDEDPIPF